MVTTLVLRGIVAAMSETGRSIARGDLKPRSHDVTTGIQKAAARAMLRAVGMTEADWDKPQIGVASSWEVLQRKPLATLRAD